MKKRAPTVFPHGVISLQPAQHVFPGRPAGGHALQPQFPPGWPTAWLGGSLAFMNSNLAMKNGGTLEDFEHEKLWSVGDWNIWPWVLLSTSVVGLVNDMHFRVAKIVLECSTLCFTQGFLPKRGACEGFGEQPVSALKMQACLEQWMDVKMESGPQRDARCVDWGPKVSMEVQSPKVWKFVNAWLANLLKGFSGEQSLDSKML